MSYFRGFSKLFVECVYPSIWSILEEEEYDTYPEVNSEKSVAISACFQYH